MDVAHVAPWTMRKKVAKAPAAAAAANTNATVPEEVVVEILVRVADVATLFRCAAACRRWRSLVAAPSFLHRRWPGPRAPSLVGFFAQQRRYRKRVVVSGDPVAGARSPAFVPAPRSPLGTPRRSLGSFVSGAMGSLNLDDATPLASRHGLLLVRLAPPDGSAQVVGSRTVVRLAVCDLHAGTCDALPPLTCNASSGVNSCAILTDRDRSSHDERRRSPLPGLFKVLVIVFDRCASFYSLRTFTRTNASWSAPTSFFSKDVLGITDGAAVVRRGTAHWLARDRYDQWSTVDVCAEGGHASLTEVSIPQDRYDLGPYSTPWLSVAIDGTLSLFHLKAGGSKLHVWTRRGDATQDWLHSKEMKLRLPKHEDMVIWCDTMCLCADERSIVLLLTDRLDRAHIVDLETGGAVDEVTAQFRRLHLRTAVPFELDWPALFSSRLQGHHTEKQL